ncbi:MAG: DNA gyrase/topoisomerase IV subunit A [Cyclobacteriaceae bacterium]|nr:DNA gyrase/topoisomerase IV subunit A [Cyclobacteriaceae bacterium]
MNEEQSANDQHEETHTIVPLAGMYENWFLDYASYVILERAVPAIDDGLKPVQRRIMHAMKEMDDGRFNKVANVIGTTMQYHPHGDAAIGDAITNLGQKELLFETQGNWGDIRTGDRAAAARYIEVRLSKFALDVAFNGQTTEWQLSYDGRKKEPITLPVKFPLLLTQGVDGIAVGLSTKIMPHNFNELIKASVDILKGKSPKIYPDFLTGGTIDISDYKQGERGGKVKVRAKIEVVDKKEIIIKDIPYATTTSSIIDSIIRANDKGKIKIKKVIDNTAKDVEIAVSLAPGMSPDVTIDALYAFTDCEVSISPNACVIVDDKPMFLSVNEILKINTNQTVELLRRELEIRRAELLEKILFSSLEKIFIENRIYRNIEECETWEAVIKTIDDGLTPFKPQFYRKITQDDIIRLTEIKIKRISKFDTFKADELMNKLEEELKEVAHHLKNIIDYSITYFSKLLDKYGKGRERKTEIKIFDDIKATLVVANNQKLYVNRADGFIGYGIKKDEFVSDCSDIDDIIVIRKDGVCMVSRISEKIFMGKDILYVGVWKKNDERMVYNVIYVDAGSGRSMVKRFNVLGVTRDKEYDLTKGKKGSKVLYVSANPNGEAELITIKLTSGCSARTKVFDFNFSSIEIKGRGAGGNILTKYPIRRIDFKSEGVSTLSGIDIWYDASVGRLNKDSRGNLIGNFDGEDRVLVLYKDGQYELTTYDLSNHYEVDKISIITKLENELVVTLVHQEGKTKNHFIKRFQIETNTTGKKYNSISETTGSKLVALSVHPNPTVKIDLVKGKTKEKEIVTQLAKELIDVKGWKAIGNRLSAHQVKKVVFIEPEVEELPKDNLTETSSESTSNSETKTETPALAPAKQEPSKAEVVTEEKPKVEQETKPVPKPKKPPKKEGGGDYEIGTTLELF